MIFLAGARMVAAGATMRNTGVNILTQGGIVFSLDTLGANLSVRVSRIQADDCTSCMEPRNAEAGRKNNIFAELTTTNMSRVFSFFPVRSKHEQIESGQVTGRRAAAVTASEE
ncbi:MAG TPA: hypothetical protein VKF63_07170 [Terracidiphilus sp.]|nr:hypothetical protein [Terracidiphilus sp.]